MKIAYIILTCRKYLPTRVVWQQLTSLKNVPKEDIYYLADTPSEENRLFSWGAPDDYNSLPYKYYYFFRNTNLDYDWYFLMDDDTFVYPEKLESFLSSYNPLDRVCIGKKLDHVKDQLWEYFSGGAGTAISRALYEQLCRHLLEVNLHEAIVHWCADICVGKWVKSQSNVIEVDYDGFHTDPCQENDDKTKAITFHHLQTYEQYVECVECDNLNE